VDLEEGINVADAWNVVGYEGLQFELELDCLWLVALDELEDLGDFAGDWQVAEGCWVVAALELVEVLLGIVVGGFVVLGVGVLAHLVVRVVVL